ncbi:MAG TPA: diphthine synthase [Thermoplasmata archaeon]|nr:diphthine synthase [Thermoplasmata archaeon]
MGRIAFIGLGLGDDRDLSPRAREQLRQCDVIFSEGYTSVVAPGSLERLSRELGRPVVTLPRDQVEAETPILEALQRHERVAFLVVGDPFAATTHVALRLAAEAAGHSWSYLPNASVLTAAPSFLGLQHYRFGRTVSLPFSAPGFAPRSPLEGIAQNRAQDLHSLVLLDLRPEEGRFMTANDALRWLTERDLGSTPPVLPADLAVAVVARVGTDSARAWYGPRARLEPVDFGPPLHALVIPARTLHFEEHAALERVRLAAPRSPA